MKSALLSSFAANFENLKLINPFSTPVDKIGTAKEQTSNKTAMEKRKIIKYGCKQVFLNNLIYYS